MFEVVDKASADFAKRLDIVMRELERNTLAFLNGITNNGQIDATILLNSRAAMIQALRDAGFYELAAEHAATYEAIAERAVKRLEATGMPAATLTTADATTLQQLATANVEGLSIIGEKAMDDLRLSLYRNALNSAPFSSITDTIKASLDDQLKRYAYTYANTANLGFANAVLKAAGERLGAEKWEVVGPDDELTRDICQRALADPIRTKEEWIAFGYWEDDPPGGYNCRHQLSPVFE